MEVEDAAGGGGEAQKLLNGSNVGGNDSAKKAKRLLPMELRVCLYPLRPLQCFAG